jgi:hypothetical protein
LPGEILPTGTRTSAIIGPERNLQRRKGPLSMKPVIERISGFLLALPEVAPPVPRGRTTSIPPDDSDDMSASDVEAHRSSMDEGELGSCEGQAFFISYEDAHGIPSERRITVERLSLNTNGVPLLHAWCHERRATRCFRLDRISEVITFDGEVFRPPGRFFVESFGMSPRLACCESPQRVCLKRILGCFRHHLIILTHMGRTDGKFILAEQGVILDHCCSLAEQSGLAMTEDEEEALRRHVRCLRPSRAMVEAALRGLENDPPKSVVSLLRALRGVVNADGIVHPKEARFLDELKAELLGETSQ